MIVIDEAATSPLGAVIDRPARKDAYREACPRRKPAHEGAIGLSHDIRVSVTALRVLIEGMSDGVLELADPSHLARMKTHVTFLTDLVEELPHVLEPVQCGPTLRATDLGVMLERWSHAMHEVAHAKGIEIRVCVQDELPSVACQPEQISRVILNLVDNAIRHSPRKCVVVLRALAQAGEIEIQVDDSGPGFRAPAAQRVLQAEHAPVHSGDGRRGLGLLIARSIVEAHGGRLWIASQPGTASVRFSLPTREQ